MNLDIFWPKHIPSSNITVSSFENRAWTNVSVLVKCCFYLYFFLLCAVKKLLPLHILTLTCSKSVNIFLKSTCWGQKDLVSVLKVNYIYNVTYLYLFICTVNIKMVYILFDFTESIVLNIPYQLYLWKNILDFLNCLNCWSKF